MISLKRGIIYWAPVVLYCGLIVFLSSLSSPHHYLPGFLENISDKILHAMEYGILAILLYRAFAYTLNPKHRSYAPFLAIVVAMIFGVTDEFHQLFVPLRHGDRWDLIADAVGATVAVGLWMGFVPAPKQVQVP
jgi:VanZ family protein